MTDSAEHPDSHPDSGSVTHPAAEATSDISSPDVAVFLSKETTTTTVVSDAADGNTVTITETHLKAIDGDVPSLVDDNANEDELSIEDLLRQAGWESRAPSNKTAATLTKGRPVDIPKSDKSKSPSSAANPSKPTKDPKTPLRRDTGPPVPVTSKRQ